MTRSRRALARAEFRGARFYTRPMGGPGALGGAERRPLFWGHRPGVEDQRQQAKPPARRRSSRRWGSRSQCGAGAGGEGNSCSVYVEVASGPCPNGNARRQSDSGGESSWIRAIDAVERVGRKPSAVRFLQALPRGRRRHSGLIRRTFLSLILPFVA